MPFTRAHRVGTALLIALVAAVAVPAPANAHDYLVDSTPEQGSTVSEPPGEVTLTFNTSIAQQFAQVAVVDADGTAYQSGDPVVDGPTVTQAVAGLPAGVDVTLSYRVVSSDGHPIGGTVPFSIAAAPAADAEPERETTAPAESERDPAADAVTETATSQGETATALDDAATVNPVVWVGAGLLTLGIAAAFVALTRRRARTPTSP